MKTLRKILVLLVVCTVARSIPATGQAADPAKDTQQPAAAKPETPADGKAADAQTPAPSAREQPTLNEAPPAAAGAEGGKGLRLNFRGVPLEMVLNYLSDAAG